MEPTTGHGLTLRTRSGRILRVLLVEDNGDHARLIARRLKKAVPGPIALEHLQTLREAQARLERGGVDTVLLDLGLPDSALGDTLAAVLQAAPDVPVIVLTSLNDLDVALTAMQSGAQDYIIKSDFTGEMLWRAIRYAVERSKIASDLKRSNEDLRKFAFTLAHEVRNFLNVITSSLAVLRSLEPAEFPSLAPQFMEKADRAVRNMDDLMTSLLEFSRVSHHKTTLQDVPVGVVLEEVLQVLRTEIEEREAEVVAADLPVVSADPVQMRHLLQNLISNSLKYCEEKPRIEISAQPDGERWLLCVRDNGVGIPPEETDQIFEVFRRGRLGKGRGGVGIGLAFCKQIVERHGGRIWVEPAPGQGSTFCFTLPAAQAVTAPRSRST